MSEKFFFLVGEKYPLKMVTLESSPKSCTLDLISQTLCLNELTRIGSISSDGNQSLLSGTGIQSAITVTLDS